MSKLSKEDIEMLKTIDFTPKKGFVDAETILSNCFGEKGNEQRNDFYAKAQAWYYGEILRNRRKSLQITQKELAMRIGKERTYINRIEKGETDMQLSSFILIAEALGLRLRIEAVPV